MLTSEMNLALPNWSEMSSIFGSPNLLHNTIFWYLNLLLTSTRFLFRIYNYKQKVRGIFNLKFAGLTFLASSLFLELAGLLWANWAKLYVNVIISNLLTLVFTNDQKRISRPFNRKRSILCKKN